MPIGGDARDGKFVSHALQHLTVDSSDCLHDPLPQANHVAQGGTYTRSSMYPRKKNHRKLGQVTVEAMQEEEGH
jgi:hypothetical protein